MAQTRRRGAELTAAVHTAVIETLAANGFRGITMDGIAERAKTGRMPLYRRWANPAELVLDAISASLPDAPEPPETGDLRGDLIAVYGWIARHFLAGTVGQACAAVIGERQRHPEFVKALQDRVFQPQRDRTETIIRRAVERGDVDAERATPEVMLAGPAIFVLGYLLNGTTPTDAEIENIVDNVTLPALGLRP